MNAVSGHRSAVGVALIMTSSSDHNFNPGDHHAILALGFLYRSIQAAKLAIGGYIFGIPGGYLLGVSGV